MKQQYPLFQPPPLSQSYSDLRSQSSSVDMNMSMDSQDDLSVTADVYVYKVNGNNSQSLSLQNPNEMNNIAPSGGRPGTPLPGAVNIPQGTLNIANSTVIVKQWLYKREKGLRKRLITECKQTRSQVMSFEQEFKIKYHREPKVRSSIRIYSHVTNRHLLLVFVVQ